MCFSEVALLSVPFPKYLSIWGGAVLEAESVAAAELMLWGAESAAAWGLS